jgi:purine-nucleoside phosphorylase
MLYEQLMETVAAIKARAPQRPTVALILGSGLGDLAAAIERSTVIPYGDIPHFASSTVPGHAGQLLIGALEGTTVVAMQGRLHLYEGYTPQTITLPVRVMSLLGAHALLVTNAAGALNAAYRPGDFMLIRDHINLPGLAGLNPLVGPNDERCGPRFPALAAAYDPRLRQLARRAAAAVPDLRLHEGVYVMVSGPSYETAAELRFLRQIGGDAVGMSTAPEVVVARHMGLRVLGISLITNSATGAEEVNVDHAEVLATAEAARASFATWIKAIISQWAQEEC